MTKKQPFLPGFPTTICGRIRRRLQDVIAARRKQLAESSISTYALQFSHILTPHFLEEQSTSRRRRHFCNVTIFWAWVAQILEANASCAKAVSLVQAWCDDVDIPRPSSATGAYCTARQKMGIAFLRAIRDRVNAYLQARVRAEDKYEELVVKSIDGSSVQLADTPANQAEYPQPKGQKTGCGFPVMGIMGVLNHSHGGWERFATSTGTAHDAKVAHEVLDCFGEGDLACADRAFCTYELITKLLGQGAHSLMRLHQARHKVLDFRRGKKIGKNQRLVTWQKPRSQPATSQLSKEQWDALPAKQEIRLIRFPYVDRAGKKRNMVLATTLLDPERYDREDLATIYAHRWDIELRLRDVKTTLRMEKLEVKSPAMARKTLEITMIAYNLVRSTCQEAAQEAGEDLREMSFKGALDTLVSNTMRYRGRQKQSGKIKEIWRDIISIVGEKVVDARPGRQEPRAVKRRPKPFSFLTKPRAEFKEVPHRGSYRSCA